MSYKKLTDNDLFLRLGVVLEQITVLKRGLSEHKEDEIFQKGIIFFKEEAENIMKELKKRGNENTINGI